ncbi:MAG: TonB-dependent receptor, partial [Marinilabiliaceae bacterium]|nr:TonB-dependent receptor [Marinilabiliaceae bacterium]
VLRGMDKRYNYTLINGIKIPSTHNKHRYISLDLFPSDLMDRLEVSKALLPDMEGDAIAGAVNMVMKNAPERFTVRASAASGFSDNVRHSSIYLFDTEPCAQQSPYEREASGYLATPKDFPTTHLDPYAASLPLDFTANLTLGSRFMSRRLGIIVSGTTSTFHKGKNSLLFDTNTSNDGFNRPIIKEMQERTYTQRTRTLGIHTKADYQFNPRHRLELYAFYSGTGETQVRQSDITDLNLNYLPQQNTWQQNHATRLRYNHQQVTNATLQGRHTLGARLEVQWAAALSRADNQTPDQATLSYNTDVTNGQPQASFVDFDGSDRLWRHNADNDWSATLHVSYPIEGQRIKAKVKAGALYRDKTRESFKTSYTLKVISTTKPADSIYYAEKGKDWQQYSDIVWRVYNPRGATANGETFDADETTAAVYAMTQMQMGQLEVSGGIRMEQTRQGYRMQFPIGQPRPDGQLDYTDLLPSLHLKYTLRKHYLMKASYYKAINKPGFLEMVPCPVVEEDYTSQGNADIQRAQAHNIDLRLEYFPNDRDQIMVGFFYKHLTNPIEYAFVNINASSQKVTYTPINTPEAVNRGLEVDVIQYFRMFGIKANYTLTRSEITTNKLSRTRDANGNIVPDYNVPQTRPLYGQAEHVGNVSLLYKGIQNGMNAQVAFAYTGERLHTVSQFIDNDLWQEGFWQLDLSAEKTFKNGISLFAKANNLLNTHTRVFIKKGNPDNGGLPHHAASDSQTLLRDESMHRSYLVGIRYQL